MNEHDEVLLDTLRHTLDRQAQALHPEQAQKLRLMRRELLEQHTLSWRARAFSWAGGALAVTCMALLLVSGSPQVATRGGAVARQQAAQVDPQMLDDMGLLMSIGEDHDES